MKKLNEEISKFIETISQSELKKNYALRKKLIHFKKLAGISPNSYGKNPNRIRRRMTDYLNGNALNA